MLKLTRAPNLLLAQHWMNLLEQAGVRCELHNRYLQGALGDIPADQCGPEIWLEDECQEALARRLILDGRELHGANGAPGAATQANWCCPRCDEWSEPQFTSCWRCGATRP
jgi:hypothetical protein